MASLWWMSLAFFPSSGSFTFADVADTDGLPIASPSYYLCGFHITAIQSMQNKFSKVIILLDGIGGLFLTNICHFSKWKSVENKISDDLNSFNIFYFCFLKQVAFLYFGFYLTYLLCCNSLSFSMHSYHPVFPKGLWRRNKR